MYLLPDEIVKHLWQKVGWRKRGILYTFLIIKVFYSTNTQNMEHYVPSPCYGRCEMIAYQLIP